ncbi:Retrotransposon protein, Ty3-gypsy subclass [Phytophthora megakarya]|uniref:Retrotransposon protein, Ty3-gypsy subclass n=1 Tax=Phytophthora megakarya TaxID=4795 RepID=A0A225W6S2_9STRA|nr:Retrotransposon protein, Ty3-gypsy subclass [Phytophthora megakarya]
MIAHLRRLFSIDRVKDAVARFVKNCLLCLHSREGEIIPRPWSEVIECSKRNGVLHFDFLYMGESYGESKYLLVLKDHATHYCEQVIADTAGSVVVTEALLTWYSCFGLPPDWVLDQGSHFKNEVIAELSRGLKTQQTFTPG